MTDQPTLDDLQKKLLEDVTEEVSETFDLDEALDPGVGIVLRERKVTVYRDEKAAEELGGTEERQTLLGTTEIVRHGLLGELDALRSDNEGGRHDDAIDALLEQIEEVSTRLKASALTLELRAVPPVILKDTRRKARAALNIKGKGVPEDQQDEYTERQQAELLVVMLVSVTDGKGRKAAAKPTVEWAMKLRERLPEAEYQRIDLKIGEIQYRGAVAQSVAESPDFSLGI
jgi:hypothetical protein